MGREPYQNQTSLDEEINALDLLFMHLKMEDMNVSVKRGHLIAWDSLGNKWKDDEIYHFALNDCLAFNSDGTLVKGLCVADQYLNPVLHYASRRGVPILTVDNDDPSWCANR